MFKIKNYKLRFKILVFMVLLTTYYLLLTTFAFAHDPNSNNDFWTPGDPLVPCGSNIDSPATSYSEKASCDKCQIFHLARHIIDFLMLTAAPILATLFFIWGGVLMILGGANPGMLSQGKKIFTDTMVGVLIVMLAWLMVNVLIKSLAGEEAVTYTENGVQKIWDPGKWWQFSCPWSGQGGEVMLAVVAEEAVEEVSSFVDIFNHWRGIIIL